MEQYHRRRYHVHQRRSTMMLSVPPSVTAVSAERPDTFHHIAVAAVSIAYTRRTIQRYATVSFSLYRMRLFFVQRGVSAIYTVTHYVLPTVNAWT